MCNAPSPLSWPTAQPVLISSQQAMEQQTPLSNVQPSSRENMALSRDSQEDSYLGVSTIQTSRWEAELPNTDVLTWIYAGEPDTPCPNSKVPSIRTNSFKVEGRHLNFRRCDNDQARYLTLFAQSIEGGRIRVHKFPQHGSKV